MNCKRLFLIVLDSFGCGALPDAADFGDEGANTLLRVSAAGLKVPNLKKLGLFNIEGVKADGVESPEGAYGRLTERSKGKDTTIGHWEIAGIVSEKPLPVFPAGFPQDFIDEFEKAIGTKVLCNKPYSGTRVIADYGEEHMRTGCPIVYTSADSVFQIAAHERTFGLERLYDICRTARGMLTGEKLGVGRVIARPFVGESAADFTRTANRHDFSLVPPGDTLLDAVQAAGKTVEAIGKINDIFAGKGVTRAVRTKGNDEGMLCTSEAAAEDFEGLCFVNLVDFDMLYGHRRDIRGYALALNSFDKWLGGFLETMREEDVLMITADHGCDPGFKGTDHTREYIPFVAAGKHVRPVDIGTRRSFSDIAVTAAELLSVDSFGLEGESFAKEMTR